MKSIAVVVLTSLVMLLGACGGGSSGNINGNWTATLNNANGSEEFGFTTSFTQGSGSSLSVTNFNFTTSSPCFSTSTTQSGSFTFAGNTNGNVIGTFAMTVSTMFAAGQTNNQLTLQGSVSGGTITGNWTLTGVQTGCTGSGTFTMTT